MAVLGLHFCARAFSSCGERGPLFITVHGPLTIAASLVAEHRLQTRRLSSCGSRAQLLCGTWDLPRPGLEPVSPALAGRLSTTAPPGKPWGAVLNMEDSLLRRHSMPGTLTCIHHHPPSLRSCLGFTSCPNTVCFFCFFFWHLFIHLFICGRAARGILVPRPGMEPGPPAVEARSPNHWTAREVPQ